MAALPLCKGEAPSFMRNGANKHSLSEQIFRRGCETSRQKFTALKTDVKLILGRRGHLSNAKQCTFQGDMW
jgi:hypothetical protein